MISDFNDFDKLFADTFGDIDRTTLSSIYENRLRLELGADESGLNRIEQAIGRTMQFLQYCFQEMPVWLRLILWSEAEEKNLEQAGLIIRHADIAFRQENAEYVVLYLNFKKVSEPVRSVITSIINYEMAEEPSANLTCYFINFEKPVIINVYDDRGMDIYSPDKRIINELSNKFATWRTS